MKASLTIRVCTAEKGHVSRESARSLTEGLGRADHVILDFSGVPAIGQDFAHEVFRVFASGHPGTRLEVTNMSPAVAAVMWEAQVQTPRERAAFAEGRLADQAPRFLTWR